MRRIRNPHRPQLAAPVQLGQHRRVAPADFNPILGPHRNQRAGRHDAIVPQSLQLSMQATTAGSGFETKTYLPVNLAKFLRQLGDLIAIRMIPKLQTSPPRIASATATEIVALCRSGPTKMLSFIRRAPHA